MNKWWLIIVVAVIAFPTGALAQATITGFDIVDGSIKVVDLGMGAVRTGKLYTGAVKTSKISSGAVTTGKIADGAVTRAKVRMTDKTKYLSIVGSAFRPTVNTTSFKVGVNGTLSLIPTATGQYFFQAPVQLPDGARITNLHYLAYDDTSYHWSRTSAKLIRSKKTEAGTLNINEMGHAGPSIYSETYQNLNDATIADAVINNADNFYYVEISLYGQSDLLSQVVSGVTVSYTEKSL